MVLGSKTALVNSEVESLSLTALWGVTMGAYEQSKK